MPATRECGPRGARVSPSCQAATDTRRRSLPTENSDFVRGKTATARISAARRTRVPPCGSLPTVRLRSLPSRGDGRYLSLNRDSLSPPRDTRVSVYEKTARQRATLGPIPRIDGTPGASSSEKVDGRGPDIPTMFTPNFHQFHAIWFRSEFSRRTLNSY